MITRPTGTINTLLGSMINAAAKSRKYIKKNRFDANPPVENIKSRSIVFKIKKLTDPPRLRFCFLLNEIRRNMKTKNPTRGIEYGAS